MSRELDKEYVAPLPEYPKLRPEAQGLSGENGEEQDADYKFQREHKSSPLKQCLLAGSVTIAALGVLLSGGRLPHKWYPWMLPMAEASSGQENSGDGGDIIWQEPDNSFIPEEELDEAVGTAYEQLHQAVLNGSLEKVVDVIRQNSEVLVTGQEPGTVIGFDGETMVDVSVVRDFSGLTGTYTMEEYEECGDMMTAYRFQLAFGTYENGALTGAGELWDILCDGSYFYGFNSFDMTVLEGQFVNGELAPGSAEYIQTVMYPGMEEAYTYWMFTRLTGTLNEALHWNGELLISNSDDTLRRRVNVDENGTVILDELVYDARADEAASTYYGTLYEPAGDKGYPATYYSDTVAFYPNFPDGRNWMWEAGVPTFPEPSGAMGALGRLE